MIGLPPRSMYHRWIGWHAPALRRLLIATTIGVVAAAVALRLATWQLALLVGWCAASVTFLTVVGPIVVRADGLATRHLATQEDETRGTAGILLLGASVASLLAVGFALSLAGHESGPTQALLVAVATLTVTLSWTVVNVVFTLRYAHLCFRSPTGAIGFDDPQGDEPPSYRDFAYVAFTIGMTYQVSDTSVRDRRVRRTVLLHALLSYLFGVVIVAAAVNVIAGMIR